MSDVLKPAPHVVSRVVQGRALILDHQRDEVQQLNEVGSFIWDKIMQGQSTQDEISVALFEHFEVTRDQIEKDLVAFLDTLRSRKLLLE